MKKKKRIIFAEKMNFILKISSQEVEIRHKRTISLVKMIFVS